jgi:hypothetical protein
MACNAILGSESVPLSVIMALRHETRRGNQVAAKVIELKGNKAYKTWIEANGDKVKVLKVQATLVAVRSAEKNYTVTYTEE